MTGRVITAKMIAGFKEHLILNERSAATVEKYIRDVLAFTSYAQNKISLICHEQYKNDVRR